MTPKKALLVVSDHGFHWDELADVFHVFDDAHWQLEIASPLGHPKADPLTLRPNPILHFLGRATTRTRLPKSAWWGRPVVEAIMRARRLDQVKPETFDAIYVVGGLGEVEDLHGDIVLASILGFALGNGLHIGGREKVLRTFRQLEDVLQTGHLHATRTSMGARKAAWRLVESAVFPEDLHGTAHVAEFLDKKSGGAYRRFS